MARKKPLVSVLVPTRNSQRTLQKHLQSIRNQSYPKIEIIVVDNNSQDQTKTIARKFTKKIYNYGPERSAQRNFAAKKAKGKYLLVPDSDMILTRQVIKECVELAERRTEIKEIVIPEKSIGSGFWVKVKALERDCYAGEANIEAARFFEKKAFWSVGGYDEKMTGPEDWDFPQRIAAKYPVGRVKAQILHDESKMSFFDYCERKYYYAQGVRRYLKSQKKAVFDSSFIYFLRPAFYKNWRKLIRQPILTFGLIGLLVGEQVAGVLGFVQSYTPACRRH